MIREESKEKRVVHEGHEGHEEETKDKKEGDQMELLYRDEVYAIVGRALKATEQLTGRDEAQILNYLKATGLRVGLLLNFGSDGKLEWKRFVR